MDESHPRHNGLDPELDLEPAIRRQAAELALLLLFCPGSTPEELEAFVDARSRAAAAAEAEDRATNQSRAKRRAG